MDYIELGYFGLFLVCFLSATILPLASEAVLLAFLAYHFDPITCLVVATIGNTLGGMTNYLLGMLGKTKTLKRLINDEAKFDRTTHRIEKYGVWLANQVWEEKTANYENYERLLADVSADLILLPEMFNTGFSMNTSELGEEWGASASIDWLQKIATQKNAAIYTSH